MIRRSRIAAATTMAAALGLAALPASAQESTDATVTLQSNGGLEINVPDGNGEPIHLATAEADGTGFFAPFVAPAGAFGTVEVVDRRAAVIAAWTATASGTSFDLQDEDADPAGDPNHRILGTAITYTSGAVTVGPDTVGIATPAAGTLAATVPVVFAGSGSNSATWSPTLTFTPLPTQAAGTYRGTITHSVS